MLKGHFGLNLGIKAFAVRFKGKLFVFMVHNTTIQSLLYSTLFVWTWLLTKAFKVDQNL